MEKKSLLRIEQASCAERARFELAVGFDTYDAIANGVLSAVMRRL